MFSVSFEIKLLGSFGLYRDGKLLRPQSWGIRTTRALLKHLTARERQTVTDDLLLDTLWPDQDFESARRSLRVRVSELRKLFAQSGTDGVHVVKRVPGGYRFERIPGVVEVDVARFTEAVSDALAAVHPDVIVERAQEARRLYSGDFLQDELYDESWEAERIRLRTMWLNVSEKLADGLADQGDYDTAIEVTQSILSASDPKEEHYRSLMLLHYKAGRQTEALRVFEQCQVALDTLFGARPMPETMELAESIVRQQPVSGAAIVAPLRVVAEQDGKPTPARPRVTPVYPFLGRQEEVQYLRDSVAQLEQGTGGVVWVSGDSGIGKSRLLDEVFRENAPCVDGKRIIPMRGHGVAHAVPFSTLLDGLQKGLVAEGTGLLEDARGWADSAMVRSGASGVLDSLALHGTWLRQKLLQLLRELAEERPLVLVVDNAEDVDDATWGVLVALSELVGEHPVFIVIACREAADAMDAGKALAETASRFEHMELLPLNPPDLVPLIGETPPTSEMRRWLSYVHSQTDGEPFAMTELLRWMEQSGLIARCEGGSLVAKRGDIAAIDFVAPPRLPIGVQMRNRLDARIAGLSRRAYKLLVQAAVLGDSVTPRRLQILSRLEDGLFMGALEELLAIGFVEESLQGEQLVVRLAHARLQNYVYHGAEASHRRWLHRQIAYLIEREIDEVPEQVELPFPRTRALLAMEIAYHAEAAGDFEQACRWSLLAADGVAARVGGTQAVSLYRHALRLAEKLPQNNRWIRSARRGLGESLFASYAFAEALPFLERELEEMEFASLADFETASRLALAYMQFQRTGEAQQLAARLLDKTAKFSDPHVKGSVLLAVSFLTYRLGQAQSAIEQARESIDLFHMSNEAGARLRVAFRWLSLYYWDMSEYGLAIEYARKAVAKSRANGDTFELIHSLNQLGELYQDLFCVRSAQGLHEEALHLASESDHALLTSEVWRNIGMNFLYKNKSDKAFHALERAWQHTLELDASPYRKEIALRSLIEAYLLAGEAHRVADLLSQYEQMAGPREYSFVAVFRGALALLRGDWQDFQVMFAQTEKFWSETKRRAREHHVLFFMGRTLIARGFNEHGRKTLQQGVEALHEIAEQLPDDLASELLASRAMQEVLEIIDSATESGPNRAGSSSA